MAWINPTRSNEDRMTALAMALAAAETAAIRANRMQTPDAAADFRALAALMRVTAQTVAGAIRQANRQAQKGGG
jgi:hypothetical protein